MAEEIKEEIELEIPEAKSPGYKPDERYFGKFLEKFGSRMLNVVDTKSYIKEGRLIGRGKMKALEKRLFTWISYIAKNTDANTAREWIEHAAVESEEKKIAFPVLFYLGFKAIATIGKVVAQIKAAIKKVVQKGTEAIVREATKTVIKKPVQEGIKQKIKTEIKDQIKEEVKDKDPEQPELEPEQEPEPDQDENHPEGEYSDNASGDYDNGTDYYNDNNGTDYNNDELSSASLTFSTYTLTAIETAFINLAVDSVNGALPTDPDSDSGIRQGHNIIQYFFDVKSYDSLVEYRLRMAMNKIEQASCVRFESVLVDTKREDYSRTLLRVTNPNNQRECSHEPSINSNENVVQLVLGIDCLQDREILHSLLHAIGFNDEVTHPQRDKYVRIVWDNIHPKYRKLFRIKNNEYFASHAVEYDPLSIMQFSKWAFSSNGRPSIIPVTPDTWYPSNELSEIDQKKLRILFGQACTQRKLAELMDSCKVLMACDKQNVNDDNNGDHNKKDDDGNDNHGGEESNKGRLVDKDFDNDQKNSGFKDIGSAENKPENKEADDNISLSSGPEIMGPG